MAGRPQKDLNKPVVTAHLDPDTARTTRAYAKLTGRSISGLVEEALRQYFARLDLIESADHAVLLRQLEADALAQVAAEEGRA